jgi:hypothetical protein
VPKHNHSAWRQFVAAALGGFVVLIAGTVGARAQSAAPPAAAAAPAPQEFAARRADTDVLAGAVRVYFGARNEQQIEVNRFATGVYLGNGLVLTSADLAADYPSTIYRFALRDPADKSAHDATLVYRDALAGLLLLRAPSLAARPATPLAPEEVAGEPLRTVGFGFRSEGDSTSFSDPILREGIVRTEGDGALPPDSQTRYFRGGGVLDACGRLVAFLDEPTGVDTMQSGIASRGGGTANLPAIQRFLADAGVTSLVTTATGACVSPERQTQIEAARAQQDARDGEERAAWERQQKDARQDESEQAWLAVLPGAGLGVLGLIFAAALAPRSEPNERSRRLRWGFASIALGAAFAGAGFAWDPGSRVLGGLPEAGPEAWSCAAPSPKLAVPGEITVDARRACVTDGGEPRQLHRVGRRLVDLRRPASRGWDGLVEIETFDLQQRTRTRKSYRLPAAVLPAADQIWGSSGDVCGDPDAAREQAARYRFVAPYLDRLAQTGRTFSQCEVPGTAPAGPGP